MLSLLPQGQDAALVSGVSYSIPGLFLFSGLVYEALAQVKAKFSYEIPVKYMYGAPQVRWNGGRLIFRHYKYTVPAMEAELTGAAEHGIIPLLTFSTPAMDAETLKDPEGNALLAILNDLHGGVIVSHPMLEDYIRTKFPQIEVHSSVIVTAYTEKRDEAYYRTLAERYSRYVVHTDDNFDRELLRKIPAENAEIILNERCGYQCVRRRAHYDSIAEQQPAIIDGCTDFQNFLEHCPYVPDHKQKASKERHISLTVQETKDLAKMGFNLFKLQGRLDNPYVFFFEFFRYSLEETLAFPTMYPIFAYEIQKFMKERQKKWQKQG